jgi:hypothetical protein
MPAFIESRALARFAVLTAAVVAAGAAQAADFNTIGQLDQAEFRAFSQDVAAAVSYKPMIPAESLGITGFDLGVSATGTSVAHRDLLRKAAGGGSIPSTVPTAALRAVKGLPFDIDIGVAAETVPGTNLRAFGGELRWAFIGGSTLIPAVALRVATMNLAGVDQLSLHANSIDLSISKGFTLFTPYAGVGYVDTRSSTSAVNVASGIPLAKEKFGQNKVFAGVNIAYVPFALVLEADKTGDASSFGAKIAVRW